MTEVLFETERLRLGPWRADQLGDLVRLHGDPDLARYLSIDGHAWTEAEAAERLALWMDNYHTHRMGKLRLTLKSDGSFIGRAGFGFFPPTGAPELGYTLFHQYQGHGYATEAAAGLRDWLFRETGHTHFIGFADPRNAASIAVLRRIGMVQRGIETYQGFDYMFHDMRKPG